MTSVESSHASGHVSVASDIHTAERAAALLGDDHGQRSTTEVNDATLHFEAG